LLLDPALRRRLAEQAPLRVARRHDLPAAAEALDRLLHEACA